LNKTSWVVSTTPERTHVVVTTHIQYFLEGRCYGTTLSPVRLIQHI